MPSAAQTENKKRLVERHSGTPRLISADARILAPIERLSEDSLSPLFEGVIDATEEAIDNSLLRATTVRGRDGHVAPAIPIDRLRELLKRTTQD